VVHQPRLILARHITEHDGVPITSPTRTIFDLAGRSDVHPLRLERALDTAMSRGLVSSESLTAMLADLAEKGRPGITLLRGLIAPRSGEQYRPPESGLESRFRQLASQAGLSEFVRQVNVGSEVAWVGRVDFRHTVVPLVVEVDSATHHGSLTDQEHDRRRRAELAAAGWQVVSVTGPDLFHQPDAVIAHLRRAIHSLRRVA
jgi:very-short-patch-repair endonuclease